MNNEPDLKIPFIDIFAGPGGLSEGFSRYSSFFDKKTKFESRLAIEKDPVAVETLRLRSFFRQFDPDDVPAEYYRYLRQEGPLSDLEDMIQWKSAEEHVWRAELGKLDEADLHAKLAQKLEGASHWVLLGGPPCQAYSLMGRARMTGVGNAGRNSESEAELEALKEERISKFEADHRHYLYREYLRIVAVHQPSIFVMENVKGILSAKLPESSPLKKRLVFDQIRQDLSDPWFALKDDPKHEVLASFHNGSWHKYRLYSFVTQLENDLFEIPDRDFLIRAEHYGVPQKRHRVIILGVRDDIRTRPEALTKSPLSTLQDTIGDLPHLRSGLSKGDESDERWREAISEAHSSIFPGASSPIGPAITKLTYFNADLGRGARFVPSPTPVVEQGADLRRWLTDEKLNGVLQHESRGHMTSDLVRYFYAATEAENTGSSPSLDYWPVQLLPNHKNISVDSDTGKPSAEGFHDRFKVQVWHSPSSTITSHIAKDGHFFIHPDPMQCRSLTVREAARLQTFPDNYFFCGNRTQQYHQIGNAVPPYLAVQLAEVVASLISAELTK